MLKNKKHDKINDDGTAKRKKAQVNKIHPHGS
jgi:hypothetical protein